MIVVLGGGESGAGSAVLARAKGIDVFLSDGGVIAPRYAALLEEWKVPFEQGGHTPQRILQASEVIKSPGIPDTAPIVAAVRAAGIPVISEIEFAGRYTSARTIVITGSNGKTTTTSLIYKILSEAGYNTGLAGNIGDSFALQVATTDRDWYVIELSSFQLDGMYNFRADIAVLLNITPDHLDRYDYKMENYVASKLRVIQNQRPEDFFIYSGDDPEIRKAMNSGLPMPMRKMPFSVKYCTTQGAWFDGERFRVQVGQAQIAMLQSEIQIKGIHNLYNAMASATAALAAGVPADQIRASIASFRGVEHRLEPVATIDGIEYINDSKATNVDSVWYALQSMTRPVVWIAGGTDKGNDYGPLKDFIRTKARGLICLGANNDKLLKEFDGIVPLIVDTHSIYDAVAAAQGIAQPGDVVLLSPACASFDLFLNYEDRGRQFKEQVLRLKEEEKK